MHNDLRSVALCLLEQLRYLTSEIRLPARLADDGLMERCWPPRPLRPGEPPRPPHPVWCSRYWSELRDTWSHYERWARLPQELRVLLAEARPRIFGWPAREIFFRAPHLTLPLLEELIDRVQALADAAPIVAPPPPPPPPPPPFDPTAEPEDQAQEEEVEPTPEEVEAAARAKAEADAALLARAQAEAQAAALAATAVLPPVEDALIDSQCPPSLLQISYVDAAASATIINSETPEQLDARYRDLLRKTSYRPPMGTVVSSGDWQLYFDLARHRDGQTVTWPIPLDQRRPRSPSTGSSSSSSSSSSESVIRDVCSDSSDSSDSD